MHYEGEFTRGHAFELGFALATFLEHGQLLSKREPDPLFDPSLDRAGKPMSQDLNPEQQVPRGCGSTDFVELDEVAGVRLKFHECWNILGSLQRGRHNLPNYKLCREGVMVERMGGGGNWWKGVGKRLEDVAGCWGVRRWGKADLGLAERWRKGWREGRSPGVNA
jgi:hypothetical protein